jgi:signal transduction histidine kinase
MTKILIIDDDESLREVIRLSLESADYEVLEAADGREGVELANRLLPDLILCDVRMEHMDGYDTLSALRRNTVTTSIPVILMTGQADAAGMRQGMELGADDYLPKPFKLDQLIGAVGARLRKQQTLKEQATKQLSELRTNISLSLPHELLTPLNGIFGFADILSTDAGSLPPEEIESMAKAIRESAERLHRLIQNFLLLAHLQLHADDPSPLLGETKRVQLRRAVEEVSAAHAATAKREADLELSVTDVEAVVGADYWAKMVEELVDNAFKFSEAGTPVRVSLDIQGALGVLRVTDRGRGMRPENLAEIGAYMQFERRFYEQQGSGLGLALAKRLVEIHGGRLTLTSEAGQGTQVELALPLSPASA